MPNARRGSDSCSDPRDGEHTQANAYPRQNIGGNQSTSQHAHNYNEVSAPEPGCDPQQRASTGEAVALTRLCRPAPPETAAPTPSNVRPTLLFRATAPAAARQSNRVEAMAGCRPRTCYQHRHEQTTGHSHLKLTWGKCSASCAISASKMALVNRYTAMLSGNCCGYGRKQTSRGGNVTKY